MALEQRIDSGCNHYGCCSFIGSEYLSIPGCEKTQPKLLALGNYWTYSGSDARTFIFDFRKENFQEKRLKWGVGQNDNCDH